MSFLPENYQIPQNEQSRYLNPSKIQEGEVVRFRILSKPVIGWEYWNNENKPVRLTIEHRPKTTPVDAQVRDGKVKISHFWAMVVWNYTNARLEILHINQKTIQESMKNYIDDQDYGNPFDYDFKLSKTGDKLETKYSLIATPPKPFDEDLKQQAKQAGLDKIDLKQLFVGGNPFEFESGEVKIENIEFED